MPLTLETPVSALPGVGPKREAALRDLGVATIGDLLWHVPTRYEDRRTVVPIADIASYPEDGEIVVSGTVESVGIRRSGNNGKLYIATVEVADDTATVPVVFFGGFRSFSNLRESARIALYGVPQRKNIGRGELFEFVSPEYVIFKEGEGIPAEWARLVPVYPTTAEVPRNWLSKLIFRVATATDLEISDELPERIRTARSLPSLREALRGIHAPRTPEEAGASRRRLAYQELFDAQKKIRDSLRVREGLHASPLASGREALERFLSSLPFELTDAQKNAAREISDDLARTCPMRRLLHGDVGSGKTVVALAAVAQCVGAGRQAAILVPTTILSAQFFRACEAFLATQGVRVAELRGGASRAARAAVLEAVARGEIDVLVGTHALLEEDVHFASLGLLVVDEQHRFGVRQREALAARGCAPHVLTMSATPIPRTLCMALYGDIDVSAIHEKPKSRKPVATKIVSDNHIGELYAFLTERAKRGDRCFWVCPLIGEADDDESASVGARAAHIEKNTQTLAVDRLHGAMSSDEKRAAIARFDVGETHVLVSTTVVEVGVDVPDAAIMVVEGATRFGLSQLHQLRGRVGRGSRAGICILLDSARNLSCNRRMEIMLETDDGFRIAEEDLRIRGAGEIAGLRQHGFGSFRVADLSRDADLLTQARDDVASLEG